VLEAREYLEFSQQAAGALIVIEDVLKALARVLTARWEVNNLHNFAVRAPSKLLDFLKAIWQLKVTIEVCEPQRHFVELLFVRYWGCKFKDRVIFLVEACLVQAGLFCLFWRLQNLH